MLEDALEWLDAENEWPLSLAIGGGEDTMTDLLLELGSRANFSNEFGRTPLHIAAEHGAISALNILITKDAYHSPLDEDGNTPLHDAAYYNRPSVAERLINAGAHGWVINKRGKAPLECAAEEKSLEVCALLLGGPRLLQSVEEKSYQTRDIYSFHYSEDLKSEKYWHLAVASARSRLTRALMVAIEDTFQNSVGSYSRKAYYNEMRVIPVLELLMWAGANPNTILDGLSCVERAELIGRSKVTELLRSAQT